MNVEYQRASKPKAVRGRRPLWPCRETIAGVVYDHGTALSVGSESRAETIYRTPGGDFFSAASGDYIRPMTKAEVVEAIIAYRTSSAHFAHLREFMPRTFANELRLAS